MPTIADSSPEQPVINTDSRKTETRLRIEVFIVVGLKLLLG